MTLTETEMRAELGRQVKAAGGVVAFARKADLPHASVSLQIRGERAVSDAAANACGFLGCVEKTFRSLRNVK